MYKPCIATFAICWYCGSHESFTEWKNIIFNSHPQTMSKIHRMQRGQEVPLFLHVWTYLACKLPNFVNRCLHHMNRSTGYTSVHSGSHVSVGVFGLISDMSKLVQAATSVAQIICQCFIPSMFQTEISQWLLDGFQHCTIMRMNLTKFGLHIHVPLWFINLSLLFTDTQLLCS